MIVPVDRPLPGTMIDPMYPEVDEWPGGDNDFHNKAVVWLWEALQSFFRLDDSVYVTMKMVFYFEFGNPKARRDPDVLVAKGVGKHDRRSFRVWEEGRFPRVLFEVLSRKTWRTDVNVKRDLYESLKIPEYYIFDPECRFMEIPLRGFRLKGKKFVELQHDAEGGLVSRELGLRMVPEHGMLRLYDAKTGSKILTRLEKGEADLERISQERAARQSAEEQAEASRLASERERAARQSAEEQAEASRLASERERAARQSAEEQAEASRLASERESQFAKELAEENARLREELRRLKAEE